MEGFRFSLILSFLKGALHLHLIVRSLLTHDLIRPILPIYSETSSIISPQILVRMYVNLRVIIQTIQCQRRIFLHPNTKKAPQLINELFFLRSMACLSVVLIHAISYTYQLYELNNVQIMYLKKIQMSLMYATPSFVCISLIILSHSYKNRKPQNFWRKRWQYLLLPYFCIGLLYATAFSNQTLNATDFIIKLLKIYFLGEWVGYFVIIIIQFYGLYFFLDKQLQRFHPITMIIIGFLINFTYLYYINFVPQLPFLKTISFYKYSHLFFLSWIFYFLVGYYIGRNLKRFTQILNRYWYLIFIGIVVNYLLILYLFDQQILTTISSKRVDILLYTCCVLFGLYYIGSKLKRIPSIILLISQSSYGIYLLHDIVLKHIGNQIYRLFSFPFPVYLLLQFLIGVFVPMGIVYLFNKWNKGAFLVGKINLKKIQQDRKNQSLQVTSQK